ncbi:hypothetical protein VIGAN_UM001400 [Vigna angularis var. angularis]|uniref:Uncharacterized protein n=1 Tax=Vigna angularis var. angularis TaxID=157739 RepID=A0A0S3TDF6_PHAAN|nr:uncharacterized protein LOC128195782 isoform X4 [Vigna angularis]XP_052733929.1 uncharacterized protein LOC108319826 isoform X4 [Vigna angularis]BAU03025.1 hypothetical protein VIGAN_UM001400 [Vigna angularis var. angularis]
MIAPRAGANTLLEENHNVSLSHQKRAIRSFIGCPSAKDFAALWGFELNEIENCASQDQFDSVSCVSVELNVAQVSGKPDIQNGVPSLLAGAKLDEESTSQQGTITSYVTTDGLSVGITRR